jgi:hypothetical protein
MLYGRAEVVKSRAKKKLKEIVEGRAFEDLDCEPFLDTGEVTGLLLVEPEHIQLQGEYFHCYALTLAIFDLVPASQMLATMDVWMKWSLSEAWRFLGAVDQHTTNALHENHALLIPYVETAVRFWPELKSEGKRYGPFVNEPKEVWGIMNNLKYSLANLGIAVSELQAEPPCGPAEFLAQINQERTTP